MCEVPSRGLLSLTMINHSVSTPVDVNAVPIDFFFFLMFGFLSFYSHAILRLWGCKRHL